MFDVSYVELFFISFWIVTSSKRRCSSLEVFYKIGALKNFAKLAGKHLCRSLFFNKILARRPVTLLKQRLLHRCFSVNFAEFLGSSVLWNIWERPHLKTEASRVITRSEACQKFDFLCTEELVFW